ncbi:hypothetical protein PPL_08913 [Heterostelium album PN500]|uniref:Uncharacterized protein n=1 Tax=Heterostelium pallidum (strain ATCC 26659 / Pp 5 / PN500) TaxID=670386 RepID=D3BK32_HETP5|nr:hypothetical protein PPL_08913 [Heterostelium album PN500]EFA78262.1 hypothetical protein PPL_08913 [Heterostelium album PN500]|eukprot:XP_020430387.1 hypothetical protein PPL_08913 [Heterostelium album PN500]
MMNLTNLSHLLLSHIISFIESNIDRVCFALVSKRLYYERSKYLYFNVKHLYKNHQQQYQQPQSISSPSYSHSNSTNKWKLKSSLFKLQSFQPIIIKSIDKYILDNLSSNGLFSKFENEQRHQSIIIRNTSELSTIPNNVTHLMFFNTFNQSIQASAIPDHILHISFGEKFNKQLRPGCLPPRLESLYLGWAFNQSLGEGVLPPTLKQLTMASFKSLPSRQIVIPSSVTHLAFEDAFEQTIPSSSIPTSVKHLSFNYAFTEPLPIGLVPSTVTHLAIYLTNYDRKTDNPLPKHALPEGVVELDLGSRFDMILQRDSLPLNLEILKVPSSFFKKNNILQLPASINTVVIESQTNSYTIGVRRISNNQIIILDESLHGGYITDDSLTTTTNDNNHKQLIPLLFNKLLRKK